MKLITGQTHHAYKGQTTIALDGLAEANGLVKAALGDEKFLSASFKEQANILRWNAHYGIDDEYDPTLYRQRLEDALRQIETGDPKVTAKANTLCEQFVEHAKLVEPSLTMETSHGASEEGVLFDPGKIASNDPMAFFAPKKTDRPRNGYGEGAFRILINTDVAWWGDPSEQTAALMAVVILLQRQSPVEIWVQQGWMGHKPSDGITLFRIFNGAQILPQHLYFWVGSPYKDSPYSYVVNKMLRRQCHGVSQSAELPCDLYVYGPWMPRIDKLEHFGQWVAKTARPMLFDEEHPDGWTGYKEKFD